MIYVDKVALYFHLFHGCYCAAPIFGNGEGARSALEEAVSRSAGDTPAKEAVTSSADTVPPIVEENV